MELLIIIGLILLNGIFSMSEIALISARKSKLKHEAKHGGKSAQAVLKLSNNPDNFLSTIQVGITLIGILTGMYSGDVLAVKVTPYVVSWGIPHIYAYPATRIVLIFLVTYLTIIFGELLPKRIGLSSAEKIAKAMARPMTILSKIFYPFVWILSWTTNFIFGLLRIKKNDNNITEEEIKTMIREGTEGGEVLQVEQDIVERVFNLGDRDLGSIMTPRPDIIWIDKSISKEELKNLVVNEGHNRYPVAGDNLDHIEGVVSLKDVLSQIDNEDFNLDDILLPAQYFYKGKEVYSALEQMKERQNYYGIITDEFGTFRGIVTLKDIVEALIGDMPEINEAPEIIKRKDNTFLIDGQCPFYNFLQYFKKEDLYPGNEYNTLSGLILEKLEHIPQTGEILEWKDFRIEIVDMDGPRIDKVLVETPIEAKDERN